MPMALGVILVSNFGFRMVEIITVVDFTIFLSRKAPKAIKGPLQNWVSLIPGNLKNQSVSRTYVAWPPSNFLNNQNPKKVNINIWVIEKTRVIV